MNSMEQQQFGSSLPSGSSAEDSSSSSISSIEHDNDLPIGSSSNFSSTSTASQEQLESSSAKSCLDLDALFTGLNHFFRSEDILKESEHSSLWLGNLIFAAYLLVIVFGAVGNLLTIMAVLRNKQMHTVRNFFIVNLAMSDFFVCTVTAPTTLYTVLYVFWPFSRIMCKFAGSLQGFNIFLSTFSITAIALDRYVLVIFPTKRQRQQRLSLVFFSLIWLASILLAAPLFLAADISPIFRDEQCVIELNLCNEQNERWKELLLSKEAYTVGVIILQYLLPLVAIAFAYSRIARRMGARKTRRCGSGAGSGGSRKNSPPTAAFASQRNSLCPASAPIMANSQSCTMVTQNGFTTAGAPTAETLLSQRRKSIAGRHRRTNMLLVTLVVVFACAWLPLNIFHLFNTFSQTASFSVPIFALCHLIAMCSACLNPCCYAFFNNNFRQEFCNMYRKVGLIWLYRRLASLAKVIGLNGTTEKTAAAASLTERLSPPICQTRTEFQGNGGGCLKQQQLRSPLFDGPMAPLDHRSPPFLAPQPREEREPRRVSIQREAIRMDF